MKKINAFQFGFAAGISGLILYVAMVILSIASNITVVKAMNLLFHGFDFSSIVNQHQPLGFSDLLGAILVFLLLFIFGSIQAGVYNYVLKGESPVT